MRLQTVLITHDFPDIDQVDMLISNTDLPGSSMQSQDLIRMSEQGHLDFWAIYEIKVFIGFMVVLRQSDMIYLFSLSLDPELCARGDESKILSLLNDMYPSCTHVADVRVPSDQDDEFEDHAQYFTRRRIYVRHGYHPTGRFISSSGFLYEIMSKDTEFDVVSLNALLKKVDNKEHTPVLLSK